MKQRSEIIIIEDDDPVPDVVAVKSEVNCDDDDSFTKELVRQIKSEPEMDTSRTEVDRYLSIPGTEQYRVSYISKNIVKINQVPWFLKTIHQNGKFATGGASQRSYTDAFSGDNSGKSPLLPTEVQSCTNGKHPPDCQREETDIQILEEHIRPRQCDCRCAVTSAGGLPLSSEGRPFRRRLRTTFTSFQKTELEKAFNKTTYCNATLLAELQQRIELSAVQIKIWFRNKRQKMRLQSK